MANTVYPKALGTLADAGVNLSSAPLKALAVQSPQAYNAANQFVSDLTAADIIVRSATLTSVTTTNGVITSANFTLPACTTGKTIIAVVLYHDSGVDSTSDLLAWIDHDSGGSAISQLCNGGDVSVSVNASGLFSI